MSSLTTSTTTPVGDSTAATQGGGPSDTGTSQQAKRVAGKEVFSEEEMRVLQEHVDKFKTSTKDERHRLLVSVVLPKLREFNLHQNQAKWDLRKAVSVPGLTITISKFTP
jgi:hypothetical protein